MSEAYLSTLTLDRSVMKQHDTYPPLLLTLTDTSDGEMSLTGAVSVTVILVGVKTGTLIVGLCTVGNLTGQALYAWEAGDTDVSDTYNVEVAIVWPVAAGVPQLQTVPSALSDNPTLQIVNQLNPSAHE